MPDPSLPELSGDASARRPAITQGRPEPLDAVPFHEAGPLTRWLLASAELHADMPYFVAVHAFDGVPEGQRAYCHPHTHPYDELNVFHTTSSLTVEVRLGDEVRRVDAPATVFIPAGVPHAANVVSGTGFLVAVLCDGAYRAAGR